MDQRNRPPLQVVYEVQGDDVQVDIIAVHGLGANVDWSWTWKEKADPDRLVKWLEDPDMLPAVVPKSRIMLYNYDSRWHADAPKTRLQLCGEVLARSTHAFRLATAGRPIVFVGHSLGGNVIQHGLLYANSEDDFKDVANSTVGIVFLGAPLRGTKLQFLPNLLAAIMQPAGSHDGIIKDLGYDDPDLRDKLHSFCRMLNTLSIPTSCFFELCESDYGKRKFVGGVIKGMVVEEASACIPGLNRIPLQVDHFGMNKFSGPSDRSFLSVSEEIRKMCADALNIVQRRMQPNPIITDRDYTPTHVPTPSRSSGRSSPKSEVPPSIPNPSPVVNFEDTAAWSEELLWASQNGHAEVVQALLEKGADVKVADKNGLTPLYLASQNGCVEAVQALLEGGADITVANKSG